MFADILVIISIAIIPAIAIAMESRISLLMVSGRIGFIGFASLFHGHNLRREPIISPVSSVIVMLRYLSSSQLSNLTNVVSPMAAPARTIARVNISLLLTAERMYLYLPSKTRI